MAMDRRPKLSVRRDRGSENIVEDDDGAVESIKKAADDGGSTAMAEKNSKEDKRRRLEEELDGIMFEGDRVRVILDRFFIDVVLNDTNDFIHLVRRDTGQVLYQFPSILEFRSFLSDVDSTVIAERAYLSENVSSESFLSDQDIKVAQLSGGGRRGGIGGDVSGPAGGSCRGGGIVGDGSGPAGGSCGGGGIVGDGSGHAGGSCRGGGIVGDGSSPAGGSCSGGGDGTGDDGTGSSGGGGAGDDGSSGGGPAAGGDGTGDDDSANSGFIEITEARETGKGDCKDDVSGFSSKEVKEMGETEKVVVDIDEEADQSVSDAAHKALSFPAAPASRKPTKDKTKSVKTSSKPKDIATVLREITDKTRETKRTSELIHTWKTELHKANGRLQSYYALLLKDHTNMERLFKNMKDKCVSIERDQKFVQLLEEKLDKATATLSSYQDGVIVSSEQQYIDLQEVLSKDSLILCKFDNPKKFEIKKLVEDDGRRCKFYNC